MGLCACRELPSAAPGGCQVDGECNADMACVAGECVRRSGVVLDSGFGVQFDAGPEVKDAGATDADPIADSGRPADSGFVDTGILSDAGTTPDAGIPADAGSVDAGISPDSGVSLDTGIVDTGVPADSGIVDTGVPADSGVPPDSGVTPDAGGGPVVRGIYNYRRVLISGIASNQHLFRGAVSRDDQTLVVSERYNDLYVVDRPTETLRGALTLPSAGSGRIQRIDAIFMESNSQALLAVTVLESGDIVEGRIYQLDLSGTVSPTQVANSAVGVAPQELLADPSTGRIKMVGYRDINGGYWVTIHDYDPVMQTLTLLGQNFTSAGCQDGAMVADGLGGQGVAYACGINGAEVGIYDSTGIFARGPNTGNTAHISGRPQGDYAIAVTWSSGRLAKFELGQWELGFNAPSVTPSAWNVQFNDNGERALVTGQYSGNRVALTEYRHALFTGPDLTDVSIQSFDAAPFLGRSGVIMEDAAWRPGSDCGYLMGGCDYTTCTRGYLIHYRVTNGRACP